jgi:hypothetical protein
MDKIHIYFITDNEDKTFNVKGYDFDEELVLDCVLTIGTKEQKEFTSALKKRIHEEGVDTELVYLSTWRLRFK